MGEVLHLVAVSQSILAVRAQLKVSYLNLSLKQTLNIPVQHVSLALNIPAEAKLLKPTTQNLPEQNRYLLIYYE
jgi:hypothetical protein